MIIATARIGRIARNVTGTMRLTLLLYLIAKLINAMSKMMNKLPRRGKGMGKKHRKITISWHEKQRRERELVNEKWQGKVPNLRRVPPKTIRVAM